MKIVFKVVLVLVLGLASGCRKKAEIELQSLSATNGRVYKKTQDALTCTVKPVTAQESNAIFATDLPSVGITPLVVDLYNGRNEPCYMSSRHISAPLASDAMVKQYLYYPTFTYGWTSTLVASLYFWPAIPTVIIPGLYWCSSSNQEVDIMMDEYSIKAHDKAFCIMPQEHMIKVAFVYGATKGASFEMGVFSETGKFTKFNVVV